MGLKPRELWSRFDRREGSRFRCEPIDIPVPEIGEISVAGSAFRNHSV
ncbi:hypothetical protein OG568_24845 [Streptomyces sp. NBC_01450]|nr:hypothetical protein [Streptomyces sp. NBC_01450]